MLLESGTATENSIPLKRFIPSACFLIIGLFLSFVFTLSAYNWEKENIRLEFESHAKLMDESLMEQFEDYASALHFLGDFFYSSDYVSRDEFLRFTRGALKRYPAVKAFAWVQAVWKEDRSGFEAMMKKETGPDFLITEMGEESRLIPAQTRDYYMPIRYIEPRSDHTGALGFDIASEVLRKEAVIQAGYSGRPSVTAKIELVKALGGQDAVLLLIPVYKPSELRKTGAEGFRNLEGFVTGMLVPRDIANSTLATFSESGLNLSLFDESPPSGSVLLVSFPGQAVTAVSGGQEKILRRYHTFSGRQWQVCVTPAPGGAYDVEPGRYRQILFASVAFTLMLAFYTHQKMVAGFENERRMKEEIRIKERLEQEVALREQEELRLRTTKQNLEREIKEKISLEKQRDRSILELTQALAEVRTLRGILPLCSYCKKIKDDKGNWEQVDVYINKNSQADISHGICPECLKKHHPEEYEDIFGVLG